MKIQNFILLILFTFFTFSFFACGKEPAISNNDTENTPIINLESDTYKEDTTPKLFSMFIGETDISEFCIVINDGDDTGKRIADFFAGKVNAITGKDIEIANSTDLLENIIFIGENVISDVKHETDEFVIKLVENNLYISYAEGASAFPAVSTIFDDSLFASHNKDNDIYKLSADFEISGKCNDYLVGDNEFNPFE